MKTVLLLAALVTAADQLAKWLALCAFPDGAHLCVIPGFFDLRCVLNRGAAWGMLAGRRVLLVLVSAGMLGLLAWQRKDLVQTRLSRIATGVLAGGIFGNLLDRLFRGEVVDFLDFHWKNVYSFPTFNIADAAITVGVALLLLASLPCFRAKP